jgi:uncharacterized protein YdeI (YjbR/CyaY-like superfamily)
MKWGFPVYTSNGKNIAGAGSFSSYFGIWFFQGALLSDPLAVLTNAQEGKTKAMRQWRMTNIDQLQKDQIHAYLHEAIENEKKGLKIKPFHSKQLEMPEVLEKELEKDYSLSTSFGAFPPYKQREFADYINQAKRNATKLSRLEKILPMIREGIGLGDKYRKK